MDLMKIFEIVMVVVGVASVAAAALAPLTDTKLDDKAAGLLGKLKKLLDAVALNLKKK